MMKPTNDMARYYLPLLGVLQELNMQPFRGNVLFTERCYSETCRLSNVSIYVLFRRVIL